MAEFVIEDEGLLERLELYRRQRFAPTLDEALRRLLDKNLPELHQLNETEHAKVMERLALRQRREAAAIANRAKCVGLQGD
jgi:hypothetical protein